MRILLASSNPHKLHELAQLFPHDDLVLPGSFECEEDGDTFIENALLKARALARTRPREAILADDSGLLVDALPGELGVRTSRYGSEEAGRMLTAGEKNALLLSRLEGRPGRGARFVCALVLLLAGGRVFVVQETMEGSIAAAPSGLGGFGYDPVFVPAGLDRPVAELGDGEKNLISHRGKAAARMNLLLDSIRGEEDGD